MGDREILEVSCPKCGFEDDDVYFAPTCGFVDWKCPKCGFVVDLMELTGISYEDASNVDEMIELCRRFIGGDALRKRKRIYIAGPYSKGDVAQNVRLAISAADRLAEQGYVPFIPHLTHLWHLLRPHPIEFWYLYDLEWLELCNGLLRLPGESVGADLEMQHAEKLGIPIYFTVEELLEDV